MWEWIDSRMTRPAPGNSGSAVPQVAVLHRWPVNLHNTPHARWPLWCITPVKAMCDANYPSQVDVMRIIPVKLMGGASYPSQVDVM